MKREFWGRVCITAMLSLLFMFLLPWGVANLLAPEQALSATVLLYYWVNPLFTAGVGIFAGRDIKGRWVLPLVPAVLYPLLAWAASQSWSMGFLQAAGGYLVTGYVMMGLSRAIRFLRKGK